MTDKSFLHGTATTAIEILDELLDSTIAPRAAHSTSPGVRFGSKKACHVFIAILNCVAKTVVDWCHARKYVVLINQKGIKKK